MPLWHILVPSKGPTVMEEIHNAFDVIRRAVWQQAEIDKAVDDVTAAHDRLNREQEGFGPVMAEVEALMRANPDVEAVESCGHVVARMPSGNVTILKLSHWSEMEMPAPAVEPKPSPDEPDDDTGLNQAALDRLADGIQAHHREPIDDDAPPIPTGVASEILTRIGGPTNSILRSYLTLAHEAHDRIQAGKATEADRDMMAMVHAFEAQFDDPEEEVD